MAAAQMKTQTTKPDSERRGFAWATKWLVRLAGVALVWAVCRGLDAIKDRWYVLDPTTIHEIAQAAISAAPSPTDIDSMISHIISNLTATYPAPRLALNTDTAEWVLNNAGGAMGAMVVVHASVTEYLIVFGTPLGTEGHTGAHAADDYFNVLVGEEWAFRPPSLRRERYGPGSVHHLRRGEVKQYKMHEGCFALEYARGWIPLMLPFGFADAFSSTLDWRSLYHTCRITAREMVRNLLIGKI